MYFKIGPNRLFDPSLITYLTSFFFQTKEMKQKSEGIGLVVGRVQRIEEEAANSSLKVVVLFLLFLLSLLLSFLFSLLLSLILSLL